MLSRWVPLAFLLPAWNESQIALLGQLSSAAGLAARRTSSRSQRTTFGSSKHNKCSDISHRGQRRLFSGTSADQRWGEEDEAGDFDSPTAPADGPPMKNDQTPVRLVRPRLVRFHEAGMNSSTSKEVDAILRVKELAEWRTRNRTAMRRKSQDDQGQLQSAALPYGKDSNEKNDGGRARFDSQALFTKYKPSTAHSHGFPGGRPEERVKKSRARADEGGYVSLDNRALRRHHQGSNASTSGDGGPQPNSRACREPEPVRRSLYKKIGGSTEALQANSGVPLEKIPEDDKACTLSLMEELFPEFVTPQGKTKRNGAQVSHREIPRLRALDFSDSSDQLSELPKFTKLAMPRNHIAKASQDTEPCVLILQPPTLALAETDFRRIVPRGTHIEEWRGPGDLEAIVPGRNPDSLAPAGYYLLFFRNVSYARAYRQRVQYLHKLTNTHTPDSLEAPLAPIPGIVGEGEDVGTLLNEFALVPPDQKLGFVELAVGKVRGFLRDVVAGRGFERIAGRAGRVVLFWVEGYQPVDSEIRRMLGADGRDRGMPWTAASDGMVERFEVPVGEKTETGASAAELAGAGELEVGDWREDEEEGRINYEEREYRRVVGRRRTYPRWILEFADETEARRFVRTWHCKPWPYSLESRRDIGDPLPEVNVELLW